MKIKSIEIENFRNIEHISLDFENVNIIYGENAQGKTNLIEAIYLFSGSKSFRGAKDCDLIKFGNEFARLKIDFERSIFIRKIKFLKVLKNIKFMIKYWRGE